MRALRGFSSYERACNAASNLGKKYPEIAFAAAVDEKYGFEGMLFIDYSVSFDERFEIAHQVDLWGNLTNKAREETA